MEKFVVVISNRERSTNGDAYFHSTRRSVTSKTKESALKTVFKKTKLEYPLCDYLYTVYTLTEIEEKDEINELYFNVFSYGLKRY